MRFIVADDVYYARLAVEKMIFQWDANSEILASCQNGEEVLRQMQITEPDVLLLDIQMPKIDGLKLAEEVYKNWPNISIILITGHAKFEYARKAIQNGVFGYLLKPLKRDELFETLNKLAQVRSKEAQIEKNFANMRYAAESFRVMQYLTAPDITEPETELPINIEDIERGYTLVVLKGNGLSPKDVREVVQSQIKQHFYLYYDIMHQGGYTFILYNRNPNTTREIFLIDTKNWLKQIENILTLRKEDFYMGAAAPQSQETSLQEVYQQAQRALSMRHVSTGRRTFWFDSEKAPHILSEEDIRIIDTKLKGRKHKEVRQYVEEKVKNTYLLKLSQWEGLYNTLLNVYMFSNEAPRQKFFVRREIWSFEDTNEFWDYLHSLMKEDSISEELVGDDIIEDIKQFLDENYYCQISLNDLATTKYYLNPNYLSRLFKSKVGIGFAQYLQNLRMEKAKELILKDDMNINEVASLVGYNSSSYFIQNFKRQFGDTPGAIKERLVHKHDHSKEKP